MKKRFLICAAIGFPVGVLISFLIPLFSGEVRFYSYLLLARMGGSVAAAVAVNILVCGIYGAGCMIGTQFYEIERWPLLLATVLHYLIVTMGSLFCAWFLGWGADFTEWLIIGGIQTVIFFLIWLCMYLRYKVQVKELNELNRQRHEGEEE